MSPKAESSHQIIESPRLARPRGYSNGVLAAAGGRVLTVAGQIGWNRDAHLVGVTFTAQFAQALENVVEVVHAAGGIASDICQLTIYVTDREEYLEQLAAVGATYRATVGTHYPAMALVEVSALLEPAAKVEIQALAVIPERAEESL